MRFERDSREGPSAYLVKVVDEVQLTDVSKVLVQGLDEVVESFQNGEFVLVPADAGNEVQAGVLSVDDLLVLPLQDFAQLVSRFWERANDEDRESEPLRPRSKSRRELLTLLPLCVIWLTICLVIFALSF